MFKIHSQQSKQTILSVGIMVLAAAMWLWNAAVLIPAVQKVYFSSTRQSNRDPIDADTVGQAIRLLTPSQ